MYSSSSNNYTPAVSIVCAFHNEASWIGDTISSINLQTFSDFDVIFVDDASTDNTADIIRANAKFKYVILRNDTNMGLAESLNRGLNAATAPLIARIDADDIMLPDRLDLQVKAFSDKDLVLLGGQATKIDDQGSPFGRLSMPCSDSDCRFALNFYSPFVHPAVMYRRSQIILAGGYSSSRFPAEDYDLWCRVAEFGKVRNLDSVIIKYRVRSSGSITSDKRNIQLQKHSEIIDRYKDD